MHEHNSSTLKRRYNMPEHNSSNHCVCRNVHTQFTYLYIVVLAD